MIKWTNPDRPGNPDFDAGAEPTETVPFVPWRCPRCGRSKTETYSQSRGGRIRYHICKACGKRFKSQEVDPSELRSIPSLRGLWFEKN